MHFTKTPFHASAAILLVMAVTAAPSVATAAEYRTCADETIDGGTFENVTVQAGKFCTLTNVTVTGNFSATGATNVMLDGANVYGTVHISYSTGDDIIVRNSVVGRHLKLTNNEVSDILVNGGNTVFGNLRVEENTASTFLIGSRESGGNTVMKNLSVVDNTAKYYIASNNNYVGVNLDMSRNTAGEDIGVWDNIVKGNVNYRDNKSSDTVFIAFFNNVQTNTIGGQLVISRNETVDPIVAAGNIVRGNMQCRHNMPSEIETNTKSRNQILETIPGPNVVIGQTRCEFIYSPDYVAP
jgi:hypothetical protein